MGNKGSRGKEPRRSTDSPSAPPSPKIESRSDGIVLGRDGKPINNTEAFGDWICENCFFTEDDQNDDQSHGNTSKSSQFNEEAFTAEYNARGGTSLLELLTSEGHTLLMHVLKYHPDPIQVLNHVYKLDHGLLLLCSKDPVTSFATFQSNPLLFGLEHQVSDTALQWLLDYDLPTLSPFYTSSTFLQILLLSQVFDLSRLETLLRLTTRQLEQGKEPPKMLESVYTTDLENLNTIEKKLEELYQRPLGKYAERNSTQQLKQALLEERHAIQRRLDSHRKEFATSGVLVAASPSSIPNAVLTQLLPGMEFPNGILGYLWHINIRSKSAIEYAAENFSPGYIYQFLCHYGAFLNDQKTFAKERYAKNTLVPQSISAPEPTPLPYLNKNTMTFIPNTLGTIYHYDYQIVAVAKLCSMGQTVPSTPISSYKAWQILRNYQNFILYQNCSYFSIIEALIDHPHPYISDYFSPVYYISRYNTNLSSKNSELLILGKVQNLEESMDPSRRALLLRSQHRDTTHTLYQFGITYDNLYKNERLDMLYHLIDFWAWYLGTEKIKMDPFFVQNGRKKEKDETNETNETNEKNEKKVPSPKSTELKDHDISIHSTSMYLHHAMKAYHQFNKDVGEDFTPRNDLTATFPYHKKDQIDFSNPDALSQFIHKTALTSFFPGSKSPEQLADLLKMGRVLGGGDDVPELLHFLVLMNQKFSDPNGSSIRDHGQISTNPTTFAIQSPPMNIRANLPPGIRHRRANGGFSMANGPVDGDGPKHGFTSLLPPPPRDSKDPEDSKAQAIPSNLNYRNVKSSYSLTKITFPQSYLSFQGTVPLSEQQNTTLLEHLHQTHPSQLIYDEASPTDSPSSLTLKAIGVAFEHSDYNPVLGDHDLKRDGVMKKLSLSAPENFLTLSQIDQLSVLSSRVVFLDPSEIYAPQSNKLSSIYMSEVYRSMLYHHVDMAINVSDELISQQGDILSQLDQTLLSNQSPPPLSPITSSDPAMRQPLEAVVGPYTTSDSGSMFYGHCLPAIFSQISSTLFPQQIYNLKKNFPITNYLKVATYHTDSIIGESSFNRWIVKGVDSLESNDSSTPKQEKLHQFKPIDFDLSKSTFRTIFPPVFISPSSSQNDKNSASLYTKSFDPCTYHPNRLFDVNMPMPLIYDSYGIVQHFDYSNPPGLLWYLLLYSPIDNDDDMFDILKYCRSDIVNSLYQTTMMYSVIRQCSLNLLQHFLSLSPNPNQQDGYLRNVLHYISMTGYWHKLRYCKHQHRDFNRYSLTNLDLILKLFYHSGCLVNTVDITYNTPLTHAILTDSPSDIIQLLIDFTISLTEKQQENVQKVFIQNAMLDVQVPFTYGYRVQDHPNSFIKLWEQSDVASSYQSLWKYDHGDNNTLQAPNSKTVSSLPISADDDNQTPDNTAGNQTPNDDQITPIWRTTQGYSIQSSSQSSQSPSPANFFDPIPASISDNGTVLHHHSGLEWAVGEKFPFNVVPDWADLMVPLGFPSILSPQQQLQRQYSMANDANRRYHALVRIGQLMAECSVKGGIKDGDNDDRDNDSKNSTKNQKNKNNNNTITTTPSPKPFPTIDTILSSWFEPKILTIDQSCLTRPLLTKDYSNLNFPSKPDFLHDLLRKTDPPRYSKLPPSALPPLRVYINPDDYDKAYQERLNGVVGADDKAVSEVKKDDKEANKHIVTKRTATPPLTSPTIPHPTRSLLAFKRGNNFTNVYMLLRRCYVNDHLTLPHPLNITSQPQSSSTLIKGIHLVSLFDLIVQRAGDHKVGLGDRKPIETLYSYKDWSYEKTSSGNPGSFGYIKAGKDIVTGKQMGWEIKECSRSEFNSEVFVHLFATILFSFRLFIWHDQLQMVERSITPGKPLDKIHHNEDLGYNSMRYCIPERLYRNPTPTPGQQLGPLAVAFPVEESIGSFIEPIPAIYTDTLDQYLGGMVFTPNWSISENGEDNTQLSQINYHRSHLSGNLKTQSFHATVFANGELDLKVKNVIQKIWNQRKQEQLEGENDTIPTQTQIPPKEYKVTDEMAIWSDLTLHYLLQTTLLRFHYDPGRPINNSQIFGDATHYFQQNVLPAVQRAMGWFKEYLIEFEQLHE